MLVLIQEARRHMTPTDAGASQQPVLLVPSVAHPTLGSALATLAASSASATIRLAAGVYREGTLHLSQGVSLVGAGIDTLLESEGTHKHSIILERCFQAGRALNGSHKSRPGCQS